MKKQKIKKLNKVLIVNPGSTKVKRTFLESEKFEGIGIRIVHGGGLVGPLKITTKVKREIKKAEVFAPIHNKIALEEIERLEKKYPEKDIWAVFDTDFHRTILVENYTLALEQKITQKYNLRRWGFHGSAIESIISNFQNKKENTKRWMKNINIKKSKIICVHLGGGSSVTAVRNGKSIYNSMGLTPLSGIMGKTRAGSIDPDIFSILNKQGWSVEKISQMLSNKSGWLGLTGTTNTKEIIEKAHQQNARVTLVTLEKEKLAYEIFLNQIAAQVAKSFLLLQGCDLMTLSGGIGEKNKFIKKDLWQKIKILEIKKSQLQQIKVNEEKIILKEIEKKINFVHL